MNEITIFVIGSLIFAITVYGAVMGGGLALTRAEERASGPDHDDAETASPAVVSPPPAPDPGASAPETGTSQE